MGKEEMKRTWRCITAWWAQSRAERPISDDIIWISQLDPEGTFMWHGRVIHDLYFRYMDQGLLTLHVRCTVDTKLKVLIDWVVDTSKTSSRWGTPLRHCALVSCM